MRIIVEMDAASRDRQTGLLQRDPKYLPHFGRYIGKPYYDLVHTIGAFNRGNFSIQLSDGAIILVAHHVDSNFLPMR